MLRVPQLRWAVLPAGVPPLFLPFERSGRSCQTGRRMARAAATLVAHAQDNKEMP